MTGVCFCWAIVVGQAVPFARVDAVGSMLWCVCVQSSPPNKRQGVSVLDVRSCLSLSLNRISLTHTDQLAESQTLAFNSLRFLGASSNVPTALSAASVSLTSSWTRATRPDPAALDSQDSLPR